MALKLHFTTDSYDFFKYQGKLKTKVDYTKRRDKYQIQKISKQQDPQGLILATLVDKPTIWIGDIITDKGLKVYKDWLKRRESLSYVFAEDVKRLSDNFNSNFQVRDNQHPYALRQFLGERICLETLVIINSIVNYYPHWELALDGDIVWKTMRLKIPKYRPFLNFDQEKFKKLLKVRFDGTVSS
jgi:hypothetical protein